MRIFWMLILLITVFCIGLSYGLTYDTTIYEEVPEERIDEFAIVYEENTDINYLVNEQQTETAAFSLASILKNTFHFFAEACIQILYQFSKLFF